MKKDLLFITSRFPYPLNKGDKLRAYFQIKNLSEYANIHLVSLSENPPEPADIAALSPYCKSINNYVLTKPTRVVNTIKGLFSNQPFSVSYFYSPRIKEAIHQKVNEIKPEIIHCHLIRTAAYIDASYSGIKSIDYMDCFSAGALKELKATKSWFRKLFLKMEYKRLLKLERSCYSKFDKHVIISEPDKQALPLADSASFSILPNGVDFQTFYPNEVPKEYDLLFSGHMSYIPNISAAKYAITRILPALTSKSQILIAGIGITSEISDLKNSQVVLQEHFPHIREAFWKSKILLAPMNISIGLQNKVLQAMAMKIPVVCTPEANLSINAPVGIAILTATEPEEFNEAIQRLLTDEAFYQKMVDEAFEYVNENFNWETINSQFAKILLNP